MIKSLRENLAICQHHDAIAGTAKDKVSKNYIDLLKNSTKEIQNLFTSSSISNGFYVDFYFSKNFIFGEIEENEEISFKIFKGFFDLNKKRNLKINLKNENYLLFDIDNKEIKSEIFCVKKKLYKNCELHFQYEFAEEKLFYNFLMKKTEGNSEIKKIKFDEIEENFININDKFKLNLDKKLKNVNFTFGVFNKTEENESEYSFSLKHGFYKGSNGNDSNIKPEMLNPSGAYVLSTIDLYPNNFEFDFENSYMQKGELLNKIYLRFNQSTLIMNIFNNDRNLIEIESIWDPIFRNINSSQIPSEFLLLINSDLDNTIKPNLNFKENKNFPELNTNKTNENSFDNYLNSSTLEFWTDSNGLKTIRRFKDYRELYKFNITEKVASNFYPINSIISLRERSNKTYKHNFHKNQFEGLSEKDRIISIMNDRPQSGGVLRRGEIIIIQNRFSNIDDWKGLEEPLWEEESLEDFFSVKNYLIFNKEINQTNMDINYINEITNGNLVYLPDKKIEKIIEKEKEENKSQEKNELKDYYINDKNKIEKDNLFYSKTYKNDINKNTKENFSFIFNNKGKN